jgi:hypothetical protein
MPKDPSRTFFQPATGRGCEPSPRQCRVPPMAAQLSAFRQWAWPSSRKKDRILMRNWNARVGKNRSLPTSTSGKFCAGHPLPEAGLTRTSGRRHGTPCAQDSSPPFIAGQLGCAKVAPRANRDRRTAETALAALCASASDPLAQSRPQHSWPGRRAQRYGRRRPVRRAPLETAQLGEYALVVRQEDTPAVE